MSHFFLFAFTTLLVFFAVVIFLGGNSPAPKTTIDFWSLTSANYSSIISSVVSQSTHLIPESSKNHSIITKEDPRRINGCFQLRDDHLECDIFDGNWVLDDSYPSYRPGSCPFIDEAFNCFWNGRLDLNYTKLRWQPKGCKIPRFDGKGMLEMLREKRLAFVGDSLNRNMWQSLVCMLRDSLPDKNKAFEISGRHEFRTDGFYAIRFPDFNCTIEFFQSPFLVQEWQNLDLDGNQKKTLRLDLIQNSSAKYKYADIIVFNTGHWWTHAKTSKGKDYYQEGDQVYSHLSVADAYKKALSTWARWVDASIDPNHTRIFFRGYSSSHYNGGKWNSGGSCNGETLPIMNDNQLHHKYQKMMGIFESVMSEMRTPILYLNITRMTSYRKDAHPSSFRQRQPVPVAVQDCSHWCLPGVPDAWNDLLYAMLMREMQLTGKLCDCV